jgi:hypothetical protein
MTVRLLVPGVGSPKIREQVGGRSAWTARIRIVKPAHLHGTTGVAAADDIGSSGSSRQQEQKSE